MIVNFADHRPGSMLASRAALCGLPGLPTASNPAAALVLLGLAVALPETCGGVKGCGTPTSVVVVVVCTTSWAARTSHRSRSRLSCCWRSATWRRRLSSCASRDAHQHLACTQGGQAASKRCSCLGSHLATEGANRTVLAVLHICTRAGKPPLTEKIDAKRLHAGRYVATPGPSSPASAQPLHHLKW